MAKFITGENLENAVYEIIWEAKKTLLIVSPFIKLDTYFKSLFDNHINKPNLHILIVFGKNEREISKSLSKDDFDYFKKFPNISVVYEPDLHGKYYGNEKKGVITSMNLYDYSFKNNIEFGVYSKRNILKDFMVNSDEEAWRTCYELAEKSEAIFIKRPVFEKKFLSFLVGKNYIKSDTLHDTTDKFYLTWNKNKPNKKKTLIDFESELELNSESKSRPKREEFENQINGFCIRTGEKIPFNIKKPYSIQSYRSWAYFNNEDFPENFCHRTGSPSQGKTSMRKPVL